MSASSPITTATQHILVKMPKKSCKLPSAYRGPAAIIGAGVSFALVGVVPLAITLGLGIKSSATIIGVGFIGFGIMLMLPGICWCFVVKHSRSTWWRKDKQPGDDNLQTPALRCANPYTPPYVVMKVCCFPLCFLLHLFYSVRFLLCSLTL